MPSPITGFNYTSVVDLVVNYVGNTSQTLRTYVECAFPLAQYRFCKMHDWSFLQKTGFELTLAHGVSEYILSGTGFTMNTADISQIVDRENGAVLGKVDLQQIRNANPANDAGSADALPEYWASIGISKILIHPPKIKNGLKLYIDGKISPTETQEMLIPFRYQESFIEYLKAMALDRENDDRAAAKKQEAMLLIRQDIQDDMRHAGDVSNPRIKSIFELGVE